MPHTVDYTRTIELPTIADYTSRDAGRSRLATTTMEPFWDLIASAESIVRMEVAIDLGRPAVSAVADTIRSTWESLTDPPKWGHVKQFSGSAAALVCELNGFRRQGAKADKKGRVGREHWNVGQLFERR
ncbi:MAG: hypothetical protein GY898_33360 [Proteobacteria bacterium]|nr:hypothetical protein [Pseudomonadota bacterium]